MELKGLKINFLGDSITEGYGISSIDRVYWKLLADNDGVIARGYGISGTRIARQRVPSPEPRWDLNFGMRVNDMDPDADVIVVFGGTNDYGHGDAPLGRMTDRTEDTFYGALHCLYQKLLDRYTQAEIVIMTPIHYAYEHQTVNGLGVRNVGTLGDYVRIIREVAAYYALPVLDLYTLSGIQPAEEGLMYRYTVDGLHPNEDGHARIYRLLRSFLISL